MDGPALRQDGDEYAEDRYGALVALHAMSPDYRMDRERVPEPSEDGTSVPTCAW